MIPKGELPPTASYAIAARNGNVESGVLKNGLRSIPTERAQSSICESSTTSNTLLSVVKRVE
jgi:hypothetical protein